MYLRKLTGGENNCVKYGVVCPVEDKRTDVIVRELIMAASVSQQDNGWLLRRPCICNSFTLFFFCQAFVSFFLVLYFLRMALYKTEWEIVIVPTVTTRSNRANMQTPYSAFLETKSRTKYFGAVFGLPPPSPRWSGPIPG